MHVNKSGIYTVFWVFTPGGLGIFFLRSKKKKYVIFTEIFCKPDIRLSHCVFILSWPYLNLFFNLFTLKFPRKSQTKSINKMHIEQKKKNSIPYLSAYK